MYTLCGQGWCLAPLKLRSVWHALKSKCFQSCMPYTNRCHWFEFTLLKYTSNEKMANCIQHAIYRWHFWTSKLAKWKFQYYHWFWVFFCWWATFFWVLYTMQMFVCWWLGVSQPLLIRKFCHWTVTALMF